MSVIQIQKRDLTNQKFDEKKIYNAIMKAFKEVPNADLTQVATVTDYVTQVLESYNEQINIETIQDVVVTSLMHLGHYKVAEKYILYRDQKRKERKEKEDLLDTLYINDVSKKLTINQIRTLKKRYLICDVYPPANEGEEEIRIAKEQPSDLFERVAKTITIGDLIYSAVPFSPDLERATKPLENYPEEEYGNKFYELNWEIFNKYNLNPYHAARMLYVINQIGTFRYPLLDNVEIGGDIYPFKITKQFALKFEEFFGDNGIWRTYYDSMVKGEFMFNTPVLMNFGRALGGGNACFVLDLPDDLEAIMHTTGTRAAKIFKKAGGCGINYSKARPQGDSVGDIQYGASGPCSWIDHTDDVTRIIKAGTGRRGANMGILEYWHPDIMKFITAKKNPDRWKNLNVSVGTDNGFWDALKKGENFNLINPRDKKIWGQINSTEFFNEIAESAHASAEPGLLFFDNANKFNPFKELYGPLRATNPCGEQYLYPNDSCTLGSVNVGKFVNEKGGFEKEAFIKACVDMVRGLDNVVTLSKYPDAEIERTTKQFRRIGIGVMGVADALYKMRIGYNTKEGYEVMAMIAKTMHEASLEASIDLAFHRGQAPNWKKLVDLTGKDPFDILQSKVEGQIDLSQEYKNKLKMFGIRNSWVGTEAPTGTIAMIAGASSGIEPLFGLYYQKKVDEGKMTLTYWNEHFINALKEEGLYTDEILNKIIANGSVCDGLEEIPEWIQTVFVTAMNIHWADHVYAQAVWQRYVDNSISKTINFPKNATIEDVKQAYFLAHELNCKGLSVYRNESRQEQILHLKGRNLDPVPSDFIQDYVRKNLGHIKQFLPSFFNVIYLHATKELEAFKVSNNAATILFEEEKKDMCHCGTQMVRQEKCLACPNCGNSACST